MPLYQCVNCIHNESARYGDLGGLSDKCLKEDKEIDYTTMINHFPEWCPLEESKC